MYILLIICTINYGDSSVTFEVVVGEIEHVTGDTEGLLGLFWSFLNNGFGGSGWELGPKDGGSGRSCCIAAIRICGGIGFPGFGCGINPGGIGLFK